jgi:uncharacterized protein YbcV (DUF1398 family)
VNISYTAAVYETVSPTQQTTGNAMELLDLLSVYFERVRTDADFISFTEELIANHVSYYIYFVATGNVKFVMSSDAFISMKSNRKLLRVNSLASSTQTKEAARRHFSGMTSYDVYCTELAKAGVFKWVVDLNEKSRHYWSKDNKLLHIENTILPV